VTRTHRPLSACALVAALILGACTSGSGEDRSPEEVLAAAKTALDETSGVHLRLETEKLPATVNGVLTADGVATHDPAFKGDLKVSAGGITADVPVVAAQGKVFAELPFTSRFVEVDPAAYAAPDPARLMNPDDGLSSLLTAADEVEEDGQVREAEAVLSSYTATVPGEAVARIIPSASTEAAFDARFAVDEDDRLREAVLTGPFYPGTDDVSYTISFDDYGTTADITLP
jgi:lipoprotein LprG